jgi:taurine dioxygenase
VTTAHADDAALMHRIDIRPFDAPLGAEVIGLDLGCDLDADDFARIRRAHLEHHVLVFRDQRITPEQQIAFSRRFGPLQVHVLHQFHLEGHPEILIVSNIVENGRPIGLGDAGHYWHSDLSYKERPSLGSMLHAQELPAEGGDTLFANMHLAWETLPEALRQAVQGRFAEHTYLAKYETLRHLSPWRPKLSEDQLAQVKPVAHPVVGLPQDESDALLQELFAHSTRAEHIYRHQWQPHDLVFWDNRSLMHLAGGTPDHLRRKLYRTTIEGDVPF